MKRKIGFFLFALAFLTPILAGLITAIMYKITQSDTEYAANFLSGMMMGSPISLIFSVPSLILLKKNMKDDLTDAIVVFDVFMIMIGFLLGIVLLAAIR